MKITYSKLYFFFLYFVIVFFKSVTYCLNDVSKFEKLKKLINKKIKLHINEEYEKDKTQNEISFHYIHELSLSDYIDYVLNKDEEYDCVLFLIDVEMKNNISMFDRKTYVLLELFNTVAKKIILENIFLYNEKNYKKGSTNIYMKNNLLKPIFFFYVNFNKSNLNPLKHIHMIQNYPEFVYMNEHTLYNHKYYSLIYSIYMLENFIKKEEKKQDGLNDDEIQIELNIESITNYFLKFIYMHNINRYSVNLNRTREESVTKDGIFLNIKMYLSFIIGIIFMLLYLFILIVNKYNIIIFICSYILYFICLSGLFHCLIYQSEFYNTDITLDSILNTYIYRSTNSQYIYEGLFVSFLIFIISFSLFILNGHLNNKYMNKTLNFFFFFFLIFIICISLNIIHKINTYKVYFSTYVFFPPIKFFKK
ncbi:conserved Plasmodium membrane protein, unknown function [Plasmodium berghei]|uniref:Dolichyl-diphosphooligosaccharide--protein glycosyltransferase subunit OST3/OST6, putative n=2 Tax=Plasmodium berghei TaxID=5821 RepID=A0A509ABF3_PLABA|nr:dolichyl-diphosphooligosaccharide--protein glycosyltransferase subunit OST3/OST6, putative [Plasmodium berghei ANKA]CXH86947.1 conserved Plasmodium membrane protein, unknown function [Plasmodium berghei]SCL90052.1 conserved Plasmodium membrane protein, unknown function [Plasmodium berghei]SCM15207.1 conserved Plasmodium membrane protein, unknown function [Plasmodium berghei]SCM17002.1 conserved Plasmodium membrane protein, unknown function [Plasmodium berghei]SCN21846.1 conserved Plasmodium|eukprot:XP_034419783.1 dolichyl-diphosphooligosaccharide--protein glycosyltransferase subunit OST3/OST6, putative [Plasmodium berghei ANKA]